MENIKKLIIVDFFKQLLNVYELELFIDINSNQKKIFRLSDLKGNNLDHIEQEEFSTLEDVIASLDTYHNDYIYLFLEQKIDDNKTIPLDDWDLTAKRYIGSDTVNEILEQISVDEYKQLVQDKREFDIKEIINILNEDELFYKTICERYIKTMPKEMLIEINNEILHIFIEDEYIDLKEDGKITKDNYGLYLDGNFEVYNYKFYQDLFFKVVKDGIAYDLNDLELFDENNEWAFYLSFDELRKIGYGFMVKDHYPLVEEYGVAEENLFDFFEHFSLEQLDNFEHSLYLYYKTDKIKFDENLGTLTSEENFNNDILRLSCGLTSYQDFIEDYKIKEPITEKEILIRKEVIKYFKENQIENLENYGADSDEGLCKISSLYSEILDNLNIKYTDIFTKDGIADGKYVVTIFFDNDTNIVLDSKSRDNSEHVVDNIISTTEEYEKWNQKEQTKGNENEIEIDY